MTQITKVIRKVLEGDTESFRLVVERYEGPIVRMVRNITGDRESCEDIAQDVFLTAYEKLASFDPARSNFSTWLLTIARNRSINALKRRKPFLMSKLPERADHSDPSDEPAEKDLFEELDRRLQALPARQKRAFVLAELEGLPYEEIAHIEGVPIGTVRSRINRAKKKLRLALKDSCGDAR